jgi:hypothetical protein
MFGVRRPEVPTKVTVGVFGGPTCAVPLAAREVDKGRQHTSEPPVENSGQCPGFVEQQVALVEVAVGKDRVHCVDSFEGFEQRRSRCRADERCDRFGKALRAAQFAQRRVAVGRCRWRRRRFRPGVGPQASWDALETDVVARRERRAELSRQHSQAFGRQVAGHGAPEPSHGKERVRRDRRVVPAAEQLRDERVVDSCVDVAFALELRDDRVVAWKQKGAIPGEEHMLRSSVEPRLDRTVYLADLPEPLELGRNEYGADGCLVIHAEPSTDPFHAAVRATVFSRRLSAPRSGRTRRCRLHEELGRLPISSYALRRAGDVSFGVGLGRL